MGTSLGRAADLSGSPSLYLRRDRGTRARRAVSGSQRSGNNRKGRAQHRTGPKLQTRYRNCRNGVGDTGRARVSPRPAAKTAPGCRSACLVKILIRATNWVGDAIMALPALRAVRDRFPEAHIAIVARPYVADIYRDQPVCDQLVPYDVQGAQAGVSGRESLAREVRAQKFDVALLLQNAFDAAWLAWRAGIPQRIGYARDGRSVLLTKAVPVPKPGEIPAHEQFYYLELLRRAGWLDHLNGESYIALILD